MNDEQIRADLSEYNLKVKFVKYNDICVPLYMYKHCKKPECVKF